MKLLKSCLRELWGLFVDDGSLALAVVLWVIVVVLSLSSQPLAPAWKGVILFAGLAVILVENLRRSARRLRLRHSEPGAAHGPNGKP